MARFIIASRLTGDEPEISADVLPLSLLRGLGRAKPDFSLGIQSAMSPLFRFSTLESFAESTPPIADLPVMEDPAQITVMEGGEQECHDARERLGADYIVEQEVPRKPGVLHPSSALPQMTEPLPAGVGAIIDLNAYSAGVPLDGALAMLYLSFYRGAFTTAVFGTTDSLGHAVLPYDPRTWAPVGISVMPRFGAWSAMMPVTGPWMRVALPSLPRTGPLAWWHRAFGLYNYDAGLGEGIRVGIIDTGIGDHPYLAHAKRAGAFLNGKYDSTPESAQAVADHGTHVAGIIGARPTDPRDFAGLAPGAELVAARVYPGGGPPGSESGSATNSDISQAILTLSRDEQCDLINLSSGGPLRSEIEANRINAALERGTLVICSVGNGSGPPVLFPAAEPTALGVTALGQLNTFPFGVLDNMSVPRTPDRYMPGGAFSPTFNSFGMEVKCVGPGVAIISTVPPHGNEDAPYVAMSGTSMAAPAVTGALAAILSRDPEYKSMPRNRDRSRRAWTLLAQTLRSLGQVIPYQGFGLPTIWR